MASPDQVAHFFTKVVGVTHQNRDRSKRQNIIAKCSRLEPLVLDHEENNRYDPNAIRVLRQDGEQIGFLDAGLAKQLVSQSKKGFRFDAFIVDLTGGEPDKPTLGVNLVIIVAPPNASVDEVRAFWESLKASGSLDEYAPFEELRDAFERAGTKPTPQSVESPFAGFQDEHEIIQTTRKRGKKSSGGLLLGCLFLLFLLILGSCLTGGVWIFLQKPLNGE
jgi:HIRAN domain